MSSFVLYPQMSILQGPGMVQAWGEISKIKFLGPLRDRRKKEEEREKVCVNNGQPCLQMPPYVAHAICLDQNPPWPSETSNTRKK